MLATAAWKAIAFALAVLILAVGSYAVFRNDPAEAKTRLPNSPSNNVLLGKAIWE